ncbi:LAME_0E06106g1_1 [Lachancea meyersii CBS 8951]|uniref:LAME_0E06106g1_1 n=1 Tax=Lachancea meyersii CBS 8951 TaxID=1266667 RepID=A0A1G4JHY7_9SACH|nr:LAME_0E06106g1_1 [Lachancea meyersii CBS 8951]
MTSLTTFLYVYLFGGVTFPLIVLYVLFRAAPEAGKPAARAPELLVPEVDPGFKLGELEETKGVRVLKRGWLTVTIKYYYHFSELLQTEDGNDNMPTRDKLKRKHRFYAVLKHGNLFLYKDDAPDASVAHVIVLKDSFVSLWPRTVHNEAPDATLFTKKMCIAIFRHGAAHVNEKGRLEITTQLHSSERLDHFFVYVSNSVEKEDWYYALVNASKVSKPTPNSSASEYELSPNVSAKAAHLNTRDMLYLIQNLNSNEGQLTTKWLNALIGRLFLGLQQTEALSEYLRDKVYKKLTKINKPGFLDDFVIDRIDVGNAAPLFTHPALKELTPAGLTKIGFHVFYKGGLSLIVSTKANINLGSRFKPREVTLNLSITVKEISGPVIVLIKPPPSNRIWYSFETEPFIDLDVEPIVSTKQLSYNMVTNAIKSKFREAIRESLVMPYMDDIAYYKTTTDLYRGGIWEHDKKQHSCAEESVEEAEPLSDTENGDAFTEDKEMTDHKSLSDTAEAPSSSTAESRNAAEAPSVPELDEAEPVSVRQKALQKVGTFRSMLKSRTEPNEAEDENEEAEDGSKKSRQSSDSHSFSLKEDAKASKKYFNAGIKRVGKWYKDSISNTEEDQDQHSEYQAPSSEKNLKMISNRRTLPKAKEKEIPRNQPLGNRRTSDAAEMFAKTKQRSASNTSGQSPSVSNVYNFSHTPPHSPHGLSGWSSQEMQFENSTTQAKSNVKKSDEGKESNPTHVAVVVEASQTTENNAHDELGERHSVQSITADQFHVSLQELNKRRPIPPLPESVNKATRERPDESVLKESSNTVGR